MPMQLGEGSSLNLEFEILAVLLHAYVPWTQGVYCAEARLEFSTNRLHNRSLITAHKSAQRLEQPNTLCDPCYLMAYYSSPSDSLHNKEKEKNKAGIQ